MKSTNLKTPHLVVAGEPAQDMHKRKQHQRRDQHSFEPNFRLKKIVPITETQKEVFDAYEEQYNLLLYGSSGTGKTFISCFLALRDILTRKYKKVYMVRSSVPSRDMGFLPGKLSEKMAVYEAPYIPMLNDLFGRGDAYQIASQKGLFELISTSFLRGTTFEDCIIIADEVENYSFGELDTLITRVGRNCRIIFCGDVEQTDLYRNKYDVSGLPRFIEIIKEMEEFDSIEFLPEDIVRSSLVKSYLLAKRKIEQQIA